MDLPVEFLKAYLIPGSESFLLLGLVIGVVLLYISPATRKWGGGVLAGLAAALVVRRFGRSRVVSKR